MKRALKNLVLCGVVACVVPNTADAQVIDGSRDGLYGSPVAVQDTFTEFGDNTDPSAATANGSELDALYFTISGGNLNLFVTGNLQTNNNRLFIFLDTTAGGQNTLSGQGGNFGELNGMQFDIGFSPDYALNANGSGTQTFFDFANLQTMTTVFLGSSVPGSGDPTITGGQNNNGVSGVLNNSNIGGVTSSSGSGGETVTTGLELQIPLSLIGSPTGTFTVSALIAGPGGFVSNQVLPGINGGGNLGAANTVNFAAISGDQFVAIPEPSTVTLLVGAAIFGGGFYARRRNS